MNLVRRNENESERAPNKLSVLSVKYMYFYVIKRERKPEFVVSTDVLYMNFVRQNKTRGNREMHEYIVCVMFLYIYHLLHNE